MNPEIIYLGHDNWIDVILKEDGAAKDLSGATRMTLSFDEVLIDSSNGESDPILWAKEGYATGQVKILLGAEDISAGSYRAPLVVYDPDNLEGIVWGRIPIQVEESPEAA